MIAAPILFTLYQLGDWSLLKKQLTFINYLVKWNVGEM